MRQGGEAVRRIAPRLALFLLLGAILNVVVAWSCALFVDLEFRDAKAYVDQGWSYYRIQRMNKERLMIWRSIRADKRGIKKAVPSWSVVSGARVASRQLDPREIAGPFGFYLEEGTGWPCTSMYASMVMNGLIGAAPPPAITRLDSGLLLFEEDRQWLLQPQKPTARSAWQFVRVAPTRPIFPGFALNTILYAAILWLPFAAFGRIRRR